MSVTDQLLENNEKYAAGFAGPLPLPPAKHVAVLACMDARLDVHDLLGLEEGTPTSSATSAGSRPTTPSARWPSASASSAPARSC